MKNPLLILIVLVHLNRALGAIGGESRPSSYEKGNYVSDARNEDRDIGEPLVLMEVPNVIKTEKPLSQKLFDDKLSHEFQTRYEDSFGRTQIERDYRNRNDWEYIWSNSHSGGQGQVVKAQSQRDRESEFGNYMLKRMAEYHFENQSKENENLKAVNNVKEQVTNYEVSVAPGYSVKSNYSIAGNYFDVNLLNPYVGTRTRLEMDPATIGPSQVRETRLALDRSLTKTTQVEAHLAFIDGTVSLVTRKSLTSSSNVSLTTSSYFKSEGQSVREHLGLLGYGYNF